MRAYTYGVGRFGFGFTAFGWNWDFHFGLPRSEWVWGYSRDEEAEMFAGCRCPDFGLGPFVLLAMGEE